MCGEFIQYRDLCKTIEGSGLRFQCPPAAIYHYWKHGNIMDMQLTVFQYNDLANFLYKKSKIYAKECPPSDDIQHELFRRAKFEVSSHKWVAEGHLVIRFSVTDGSPNKKYTLVLVLGRPEDSSEMFIRTLYQAREHGARG